MAARDVKTLVRWLLPPAVADAARAVRDAAEGEWRVASAWPAVTGAGWDDASVAETQAARFPAFVARVHSAGPLGFSAEADACGEPDEAAQHTILVFAHALARAAQGRERVSLLDWGGGIGQYAVLARALMPDVALEYHCRDLPALVARGRALQPELTFHDDDRCFGRRYDLVLSSSSLQYVERWREALDRLARASERWLLVTRLPVAREGPAYVAIQRPHRHGYRTEYPGWVLARGEFLAAAAAAGLSLEREYLVPEHPRIPGAPAPCHYHGFLFRAPGPAHDPEEHA